MGKPDQESAAADGARRATGDDAAGRGRRFSVGRKRDVVLRLLRGDLESDVAGAGDHGGAGLAVA